MSTTAWKIIVEKGMTKETFNETILQKDTNTLHDIQNDNSTERGRNTDENHSFKDEVKKWEAFN